MDMWGPARVHGQCHERYFLLVVDDYSRYTTIFPLRSKGEVTEVLIDWIRAARLRLRESFGSDFPVLRLHSDRGGEFSSARLGAFCRAQGIRQTFTLPASPQQNGIAERRIGMVMDVARTSMIHAAAPHFLWPFAVQYAAHQLNLQPRVSLPETSPTLLWTGKVGDASAFRVWGSRAFVRDLSADKLSPRATPCVFLGFPPDAPGWQFYHPTSRRVLSSQDVTFDESVPFYRLFPYRTAPLPPPPLFLAPGPPPADPLPPQGPAPSGVSQVDAVEPVVVAGDSGVATGAEPAGAGSGGAESEGTEPGGAESGGAELGGTEPGGAEPGGAGSARVAFRGASSRRELLSPQELREWFARRWSRASGVAGPGGPIVAAGVGPPGGSAGASGGTGAAGSPGTGAAGATGVDDGGSADAGTSEGAGVGAAEAGVAAGAGAPAGSPGAVPAGSCGATRPRSYFVPLHEQLPPVSPLPAPSPYAGPTGGLAEHHAPASCPASPARPARTSRPRPPPVPGTHQMTLRPSTPPLRVPFPSPPASSLPVIADPESDSLRVASPTVARFLATVVTDPSLASTAASALVAELVDFAACCRLDNAASLVAESVPVCPPSVGDPDAPDIPTPRSYAEAIEGPYSSQWQAAMDAEMASWKSTGTYVKEVPPPGANIVSGMWIFRVKRPPGSPPVFKARYVARGFSQRQGVDYFQTFSPTPKMTTLRVLLHVAAQRDYELHSLDFSTAFLQGSLHEEIWLRRPPGFTGSFPLGTQWSLRRPVYGLRQAPREWHDTLRTTLAALGFAPSTADPSLFLRTDTSLPQFYILVYIDDLVFATADTAGLAHVKSELQKRHTCTNLGELRSYLGLEITRYRARRTITLTQSHMVQQVLQRFDFTYSSPQATPLSTRHSLSALPSDESVQPSGPYPELVGCLMYLMTCTRPDLAYPLSILARYVAPGRHQPEHMAAAKRVLRYLCSTSGMGLVLGGRRPVVLTGHADASWADDHATQRSSQGYTFSLGSASVSWRSTRSSSVLSSSCEAEIYAGAMAAQELRWLTYLLTDLGEQPRSPPVLYVEIKAMLALCWEHRLEHRTKHIALRYFLARELQQRSQLHLACVASQANTTDIFTNALPPGDHQRFCTMLDCVCGCYLHLARERAVRRAAADGVGVVAHLSNFSPFYLTVGASSIGRQFSAVVTMGNKKSLAGAGMGGDARTAAGLPLIDGTTARLGSSYELHPHPLHVCHPLLPHTIQGKYCFEGGLHPSMIAGKIVVCVRGMAYIWQKMQEVTSGGGLAMIVINDPKGESNLYNNIPASVPVLHLMAKDGAALLAYMNKTRGATASIPTSFTVHQLPGHPVIASFSSSGPLSLTNAAPTNDILKWDLVTPGISLWSAAGGSLGNAAMVAFPLLSGTSMAMPHVVGVAALVVQRNPMWSPAQVMSAMMTSAATTNDLGKPIFLASGVTAMPWEMGAEQLNPPGLLDPGLTYDMGAQDLLNFLAGQDMGLTRSLFRNFTLRAIAPANLNRPVIAVLRVKRSATVTRTVTHVANTASNYTATVVPPPGVKVMVNPLSFTIGVGESVTYNVTFTITNQSPMFSFDMGGFVGSCGQIQAPRYQGKTS
ncbi:unnamed protein product [Closterium sp. NIES-54]